MKFRFPGRFLLKNSYAMLLFISLAATAQGIYKPHAEMRFDSVRLYGPVAIEIRDPADSLSGEGHITYPNRNIEGVTGVRLMHMTSKQDIVYTAFSVFDKDKAISLEKLLKSKGFIPEKSNTWNNDGNEIKEEFVVYRQNEKYFVEVTRHRKYRYFTCRITRVWP